jgi:type IV secretory pathway TraG/TraD family ATPase VirD4
MDTSGAKIWLPGISDPDTLQAASALCGTTAMKETRAGYGPQHDARDWYSRHPVMTPEMIRQLPARRALIVRGGMSPVIARLLMAWKDRAYKNARRAHRATATLTTVAEPAGFPGDTGPLPDLWPGWDTGPAAMPAAETIDDDPARYPWQ